MFYFFIFEVACIVATKKDYKGFNKITIDMLDVHEIFSGWFIEKSTIKGLEK